MFLRYFEFFNPFKLVARYQRDTLLFIRNFIDMEINMLNSFLGESKKEEEKEEKKKAKKVEIK